MAWLNKDIQCYMGNSSFIKGKDMKTKACRGSVLVGLVLCILLTEICSVAQAKTHRSSKYGYSIIVPDDWYLESNDIVQSYKNKLFTNESILLDAVFQPGENEKFLDFPNVVVAVIEYSSIGEKRPPTKSEMKKFVEEIIQANKPSKMNGFINKEATKFLGDYIISDISFNNKSAYRFITTTEIKDVGVIHGETVGHFGKYTIVQVSFYNHAISWQNTEQLKDSILNSFKFDSYHDYQPPSIADRFGHMPVKNIIFIIVGLVVCLNAIWKLTKVIKGKKKSETANCSKNNRDSEKKTP